MTSVGSSKIWILVSDWSRLAGREPNAGHVTCKIGPLYFTIHYDSAPSPQRSCFANPNLETSNQILVTLPSLFRWGKYQVYKVMALINRVGRGAACIKYQTFLEWIKICTLLCPLSRAISWARQSRSLFGLMDFTFKHCTWFRYFNV